MGVTVTVTDFQSIKKAEVYIHGFTVVTGPNNTGKSALVRAIRGVFSNMPGHSFVRHGCKQSTVTLEFDDGNSVTWEKGKGVNRYTINGKVYDKVDRGVPPEVADLGVHAIQAGTHTLWPQIAPQFTGQMFLLDLPGSAVAEAVADVDRVGALNRALKASEKDRRSAASTLKVRRKDQTRLEGELEAFKGLDDALALVAEAEAEREHLGKVAEAAVWAKNQFTKYVAATSLIEQLSGVDEVDIPSAEDLQALKAEQTRLEGLGRLHEKHKQASDLVGRLRGVESVEVPSSKDLQEVREAAVELSQLEALLQTQTQAQAQVERLQGLESVSLDVGATEAEKWLGTLTWLEALHNRGKTARDQVKQSRTDLATAEKEYQEAVAEVSRLLEGLSECPLCGSAEMSPEHRHEEVA